MNVKTALGRLLDVIIVDKNDSHNYTKKLDFDLYSKKCYENKNIYDISKKEYPQLIDLGGPMTISIMIKNKKPIKVRCFENTKFKEILKDIEYNLITIEGEDCIYEEIKDKTLKDYLEDGDIILISYCHNGGGGEEFYIDDDLLDPSYDYDFKGVNDGNIKFYRGGLEYKRPWGWNRYALKVIGKYENNKWLDDSGKSNGECVVSYHGTKQEKMK